MKTTPPADGPPQIVPFMSPQPLNVKERAHLKSMLADPIFRRALQCAAMMKPGATEARVSRAARVAVDAQIVSAHRLSEIAGWEQYEHALFLQAEDKMPRQRPVDHNFPDKGAL